MSTSAPRRALLLCLAVVAGLVLAGLLVSRPDVPSPEIQGVVPHFQPAEADARAVLITPDAEQLRHKPGVVPVELVEGNVFMHATQARVLTDEDCTPDAGGVSHCVNRLDVVGIEVVVRHHHRMQEVSCLRPGEFVRLVDRATYGAL